MIIGLAQVKLEKVDGSTEGSFEATHHYWKQGICHQPALCHLPADGKERLCHLLIKNRWQRTDRRQRTWLPSANSLPSASGWQIIFAICQQMAKRWVGSSAATGCQPTSLPSASRWQRIFSICWQMAKKWVEPNG